jgi:hypothetical protein
MEYQLFQSYASDVLCHVGLKVPTKADASFFITSRGTEPALFLVPARNRQWRYPPATDRTACVFVSPNRLVFGVDHCQQKHVLWQFYSDTASLASEQRQTHVFAALSSDEWCYLGQLVLESGYGSNGLLTQFTVLLNEKLPRELWHQLGGYRGWLINTARDQFIVQGSIDSNELLQDHWGVVSPSIEVTRYEGDVLFAVTDSSHAAVISYRDGARELHSISANYDPTDMELYGFGDFEFRRCWVIAKHDAIVLIRLYLDFGSPSGLVRD